MIFIRDVEEARLIAALLRWKKAGASVQFCDDGTSTIIDETGALATEGNPGDGIAARASAPVTQRSVGE